MAASSDSEESDAQKEVTKEVVVEVPKKDKDVFKVYVGGLPFGCGKTQVRIHFQTCGEIDWLHMPVDAKGRRRGIAFVSYFKQESVDAALELNGTKFEEHTLKVNMAAEKHRNGEAIIVPPPVAAAPPAKKLKEDPWSLLEPVDENHVSAFKKKESSKLRKVFLGGVPWSCTEETLRRDFAECGTIQQLTMPKGEDGSSRGIAFVTFTDKEGVAEALKFHDTDYGGCKLTVRMASEKVEKGKLKGVDRADGTVARDGESNPLEVIVKGLAFGKKEDALREALSECGTITGVRMPLNKKGKSYGFAFVSFEDAKGVKRAVKFSGSEVAGRPVTIERTSEAPAKKRPAEQQDVPEEEAVEEQQEYPKTRRSKKSKTAE